LADIRKLTTLPVDQPDKGNVDEVLEAVLSDRISVAFLSPECASFPESFHHLSHVVMPDLLLPLEDPCDFNSDKKPFLSAKTFGA